MRRILAMLLSVIFSAFNNVPYVASEKPAFSQEGIYMFEDETEYTAQELNSKTGGGSEKQRTTSPDVSSKKSQGAYYCPIAGRTLTDEELSSKKLTWKDTEVQDRQVVMPIDATVGDDSNLGNGGHDLTLKSGKYTFIFKDLMCRYPDKDREQQKVWNDSPDLTGTTLQAGQLVGVADPGKTTLEIKKNGKTITLKDFFKT